MIGLLIGLYKRFAAIAFRINEVTWAFNVGHVRYLYRGASDGHQKLMRARAVLGLLQLGFIYNTAI